MLRLRLRSCDDAAEFNRNQVQQLGVAQDLQWSRCNLHNFVSHFMPLKKRQNPGEFCGTDQIETEVGSQLLPLEQAWYPPRRKKALRDANVKVKFSFAFSGSCIAQVQKEGEGGGLGRRVLICKYPRV